MSAERRVFDKEFKLMSIELSGPPRWQNGNLLAYLALNFVVDMGLIASQLYKWHKDAKRGAVMGK